MNSFGEAYRGLMESITVPVMTPKDVLDMDSRIRNKRKMIYRRLSYAFAAVFLVLCCFAGATGYFVISGRTTGQNAGGSEAALDTNPAGDEGDLMVAAYRMAEEPEEEDMPAQEDGYVSMDEDISMDISVEESMIMDCSEESAAIEFDSREEFLANSGFPVALPPEEKMGGYYTEEYQILGESSLFVRLSSDDRQFELNQTNVSTSRDDAYQKLYAAEKEELLQEHVYTTAQGFTYTIEDSKEDTADGALLRATIIIGDFEISVSFVGYMREEAFAILDSIDLTVYQFK